MKVRDRFEEILTNFKRDNPISMYKDQRCYANWLAQTYYFVCHSTPLLGYALPHLHNEGLRRHFEKHLGEEAKHDLLLVKDLERMGLKPTDFEELSSTKAFYHSQYYRISFEGGTSLLGYILFLEGLAAFWANEIPVQYKDQYKNSLLFLKVHGEEDPHHVSEAISAIENLSAREQEHILENLEYSYEIYQQMLHDVCRDSKKKEVA